MRWRNYVIGCLVGGASLVITCNWVHAGSKTYVGSKKCAECHEQEYQKWSKYTKKSHSFEDVMKMKHDLTPEELKSCYGCHTTGYGDPTGFRDPVSTPDLKEVGCEACHGPGSAHVESNSPADIKVKITMRDCERCHNAARVGNFGFKPLVHAGAH